MLRFTPFNISVTPQWLGVGIMSSLLVAGFSLYRVASQGSHNPPQILEASLLGTIARTETEPQSKDCKSDEIFRVSDRRCYQLQGE